MTMPPNIRNKRSQARTRWNFNLTPLVDITFQLIVFFMVVSQVVSAHNEPLNVPDPDNSKAEQRPAQQYTVVNLFAGPAGTVGKIKINATVLPDMPALADMLMRHYQQLNGQIKLLVRADRQIHYGQIREVLKTISNTGVGSVELASQCDTSPGGQVPQ